MDGRYAPERIIQVLREIDADVVGLQEVHLQTTGHHRFDTDYLFKKTGLHVIDGPMIHRRDASFGNVMLTSFPALHVRRHDLSVVRREPRGALDVELDIGDHVFRIIVTHLGLRAFERRQQVKRLLKFIPQGHSEFIAIMGDFNIWARRSPVLALLDSLFGATIAPKTFISRFPVLALDRIWIKPRNSLIDIHLHKTKISRIASDHLPLKARIRLPQ